MTQAETITPPRTAMPTRAYAFLLAGLAGMSFASIFIRFAQDAGIPSLLIAAGRLTIAALALTPLALHRHGHELRGLTRSQMLLAVASGALLAVHFATWIASLEYTSVLVSVVLVTTNPLWVAVLEVVFLRAKLPPLVVVGLLTAFTGGIVIGLGDSGAGGTGRDPLLGGGLAMAGAMAMAVYLVIGRKLRARLSLLPYIWLVYGCAAAALVLAVLVTGTPVTGYAPESMLWIVALALVPQLIGHSSLNYALRFVPATYVSLVTLMEPIGSAIVAFIIFAEQPLESQILGSVAVLVGVGLASYGRNR